MSILDEHANPMDPSWDMYRSYPPKLPTSSTNRQVRISYQRRLEGLDCMAELEVIWNCPSGKTEISGFSRLQMCPLYIFGNKATDLNIGFQGLADQIYNPVFVDVLRLFFDKRFKTPETNKCPLEDKGWKMKWSLISFWNGPFLGGQLFIFEGVGGQAKNANRYFGEKQKHPVLQCRVCCKKNGTVWSLFW